MIRIELRVPEYGWTTQKVFHLMNFIVNGGMKSLTTSYIFLFAVLIIELPIAVRAVVFGLHVHVFLLHPKVRLSSSTILLDVVFPN